MSINKNFVVKHGLEVGSNLIIANENQGKVGVGTSPTSFTFQVRGGVGVTNLTVTGISTVAELRVSGITSIGNVRAGVITATKFETSSIGITSDTITGPAILYLDPATVGDNSGIVKIKGDLVVEGDTTTIQSSNIDITDKVVGIASTSAPDDATTADQSGIEVYGTTNKTWLYDNATDSWSSSENINIPTGKTYQINGTTVLNETALGSGVVNSSLQTVGTLTALTVAGSVTASNFIGTVTGISSGAYSLAGTPDITVNDVVAATAVVGTAVTINADGIDTVGVVTASSFVGPLTGNSTGLSGSPAISVSSATVGSAVTITSDGIETVGVITAATFYGDGSGLTGVVGSGSGLEIQEDGSPVGTAGTINFGANITASSVVDGVATISVPDIYWVGNSTGIHTVSNIGVGTTTAVSALTVSGDGYVTGVVTATTFYGDLTGTATTATTATSATTAGGLTGTPDISIGVATAAILNTDYLNVGSGSTISLGGTIFQGNIQLGWGYGTEYARNLVFGAYAGSANVSGLDNIAIGNSSLLTNASGSYNIAIGSSAGSVIDTGSANIAIGHRSLTETTFDGDGNVVIGYLAGRDLQGSGSGNVIIGSIDPTLPTPTGFLLAPPVQGGDNQLVIGSYNGIWIHGDESLNIGFGVTNPQDKVHVSGNVRATSFIGDGSGLTGIVAEGTGIEVQDSDSLVGVASAINFGANLDVTEISSGVVTVTSNNPWRITSVGIHTLGKVGIGSTNPQSDFTVVGSSRFSGDFNITGLSTITSSTGNDAILRIKASTTNARLQFERDDISSDSLIEYYAEGLGLDNPEFSIGFSGDRVFRFIDGNETSVAGIDTSGNLSISGVATATRVISQGITVSGVSTTSTLHVGTGGTVITTTTTGIGSVGINTTAPYEALTVFGNIQAGRTSSQGVILTAPNGTRYRLTVDNSGVLGSVLVT